MRIYLLLVLLLLATLTTFSQSTIWLSSITATEQDGHVLLQWEEDPNVTYYIIEKANDVGSWSFLTYIYTENYFLDTLTSLGNTYEYKIFKNLSNFTNYRPHALIHTGFEVPKITHRGQLLLLVDETHADDLSFEINRWIADATGDGWTVRQINIDPSLSVKEVKHFIQQAYFSEPGLDALFLLGHIPVPYSGEIAPDGHSNHFGAWPADVYYAEMNAV